MHPGASADLPVHTGTNGYDGQFYYRLALNSLSHQVTAFHITLDNPPYRQQRRRFTRGLLGGPRSVSHPDVPRPCACQRSCTQSSSAGPARHGRVVQFGRRPGGASRSRRHPRWSWRWRAISRSRSRLYKTLIVGLLSWTRGRRWAASIVFQRCRSLPRNGARRVIWHGCVVSRAVRRGGSRGARRTSAAADPCFCVPASYRGGLAAPRERSLGGNKLADVLGQRAGWLRLLEAGAVVLLQRRATSGCRTRESSTACHWLVERFLLLGL